MSWCHAIRIIDRSTCVCYLFGWMLKLYYLNHTQMILANRKRLVYTSCLFPLSLFYYIDKNVLKMCLWIKWLKNWIRIERFRFTLFRSKMLALILRRWNRRKKNRRISLSINSHNFLFGKRIMRNIYRIPNQLNWNFKQNKAIVILPT